MSDPTLHAAGLALLSDPEDPTALGPIECWREWRRVCALDLSSARTQEVLCRFAAHRFKRWAGRYLARTHAGRVSALAISRREVWHLFESHATVKQTREGKAYKQWLFARDRESGADTLHAVEGGAALIMRDVARNYLAAEYSPANTVSITLQVGVTDGAELTLEDLLPGDADPLQAITGRELTDAAHEHARILFDAMNRRERVALLAKQMRISLAHPAVLGAAGCGKSALHAAYTAAARRVRERITAAHSHAEARGMLSLAEACLRALSERLVAWNAGDPACRGLARRVEELTAP